MGQYWLGKTKPKKAFRLTWNAFKKLLWNLKKINLTKFSDWLTACLRTSQAEATLNSEKIKPVHTALAIVKLRESESIRHAFCHTVGTWWLPFIMEIIHNFHSGYLIWLQKFFQQLLIRTGAQWVEHNWQRSIFFSDDKYTSGAWSVIVLMRYVPVIILLYLYFIIIIFQKKS